MNELFTVIMPNYNNENYIRSAVQSVIAQTYPNWELIIVDDGSTDKSLQNIKDLVDKYENISIIKIKKNKGISNAMKIGIKKANGYVIGTLDSDDILENNALEYMMNLHLKYKNHSLIVSTINLYDKNMNFIAKEDSLPLLKPNERLFDKRGETPVVYAREKKIKFVSMSFRTFKAEYYKKIKGYDKSLHTAEDVDIMYQLETVGKVMFTDDAIYKRRVFNESLTNHIPNINLYNDFFRAECKQINRLYKRRIPLCKFKYFPSIMILFYYHWYRQYRKNSEIMLIDLFIKMAYKTRKTSKLKSKYYLYISEKLRKKERKMDETKYKLFRSKNNR